MKLSNLFSAVSFVRNRRLGAALAAGALATGLLLGASTAQAAPTAHAGGTYESSQGTLITFDGSASEDGPEPGDRIASYSWDFGDGSTGSGVSPQHAYLEDGVFDVTLVVTADNGETGEDVTQATISSGNQAPTDEANGP
jgi:chitodextrinase